MNTLKTKLHGFSRKRIAISAVALLVGGTVIGSTSFADWGDAAAAEETFTSGTFGINLDGQEGNPIAYHSVFSATDLQPGDSETKTVQLNNSGTIDAWVWLEPTTTDSTGGTDLAAALQGTVSANLATVASGQLTGLNTKSSAWLVPAGGSLPVNLVVALPETASNVTQSQEVKVRFNFQASGLEPIVAAPEAVIPLGATAQTIDVYSGNYGSEMTFNPLLAALDGATMDKYAYVGPYTVVLDGSELALPGAVESGAMFNFPGHPALNWIPFETATYVVTFAIETRNEGGDLTATTPFTLTYHVE